MVYDTSNNFIGDLHWQANAEIEDGDELELERGGVLVQVGERLERTETDLTPLLEKKKTGSATGITAAARTTAMSPISQGNVASPSSSRFSIASSSIVQFSSDRLKSLNEVLGIKRAPIGKAVLRTKSPYEQRQETLAANSETSQRPSKRQKRSSIEEGTRERCEQSTRPVSRTTLTTKSSSRELSATSSIVDLTEGASIQQNRQSICPPVRETAGSRSSSRKETPKVAEKSELNAIPSLSFQPASSVKVSDTSRPSRSRRKSPDKEPSSRQKSITDSFAVDSSISMLRFPTQKPRNKLMCMELLSASAAEKKAKKQKDQVGARIEQERLSTSSNTNNLPPILESPSDVNNASSAAKAVSSSTDANDTLAFVPSVSTMQALEEAATIPPPSSQRDAMISDFFKPSKPKPLPSEPVANPGLPENTSAATSRTLNRSHSDTMSLLPPVVEEGVTTDTPLPAEPRPRPQPRGLGRPLQKSVSDVSTLRASNSRSATGRGLQTTLLPVTTAAELHNAALEGDEEEQGPWTCEALDLFDFWPPGRPKPVSKQQAAPVS